jgi:hypothetical protein
MPLPGSYNPTVPQGNQQINNTQQPIETNFEDIATLLAVNHVPFNTANTFGEHNFVNYIFQSNDPSTASNEMALYSKTVDNDVNTAELFYRYPSNGKVIQLTGTSSGTPSNLSEGGYTFFVGGGGAVASAYWQYFSGGILFMTLYINNAPYLTNPFTVTFPCGLTGNNGQTVPTFSQAPFNLQIASTQSYQPYSAANYAGTITGLNTASIYYSGNLNAGEPAITVTLIGV